MNRIKTKKELNFYLQADMMMNRGRFKRGIYGYLKDVLSPDSIMTFLRMMRKYSYYSFTPPQSHVILNFYRKILRDYYHFRFKKLGRKLGFSIGADCLGYGAVIHHYGTIVIGSDNVLGNYALLNTSIVITKNGSQIGDSAFIGSGAKIIKGVKLGNNVSVGANSVVNKSFADDSILIAGAPAVIKKNTGPWYDVLYGRRWHERVRKVEALKQKEAI